MLYDPHVPPLSPFLYEMNIANTTHPAPETPLGLILHPRPPEGTTLLDLVFIIPM